MGLRGRFTIRGKRTYAVVLAWAAYHVLKSQGIVIPSEILGGAADIVFEVIFGALALLFRWLGKKDAHPATRDGCNHREQAVSQ